MKAQSIQCQTLSVLAQIIDPDSTSALLTNTINNFSYWDTLVMVASEHLVLPTLYYQLKHKNLLKLLPPDLLIYLHSITQMNRNRNEAIINQIQEVNAILESRYIKAVFVKGAAMLNSGALLDIGERMVGDIDLIVAVEHLKTAHDLLLNHGYHIKTNAGIGHKHFSKKGRHLQRLIHDSNPASIEIHYKLLQNDIYNVLPPSEIFEHAQKSNGIFIPSAKHLWRHAILNWQLNDHGQRNNNLAFRSVYDTLVIAKKYGTGLRIDRDTKIKPINQFLQKCLVLYPDKKSAFKVETTGFTGRQYAFFLAWPKVYSIYKKCKGMPLLVSLVCSRLFYFFTNKDYRHDILNNKTYAIQALKQAFKRLMC